MKQVWYADDSAGGGSLDAIQAWWEQLKNLGPRFGYYPKASKTWLIVKPEHETRAMELFPDLTSSKEGVITSNITSRGRKYLGSFIGNNDGKKNFVENQIKGWKNDIEDLARIAAKEPQLAYAAFVYGTSKRWNYVCRTTPDIGELLKPLENVIKETFLPAIIGKSFIDDIFRDMITLPSKMGGMSIPDVTEVSDREYMNSLRATNQLINAIIQQEHVLNLDHAELKKTKTDIRAERLQFYQEKRQLIDEKSSPAVARILDLASEKGVSCWLTSLPLEVYGFTMNKQEFHDCIALRYNFKISDVSALCFCGEKNSINHSLTCQKGGYTHLRHNSLRDTFAELLSDVCKDVVIEPPLLELSGEDLPRGSITTAGARLDVSARSFWTPMDKVFTDVRIFHPHAPTNAQMSVTQMYKHHENLKKRAYNARVIQVEKGTFTPLVFSTTGGMGSEAERFVKMLARKMTIKDHMSDYSTNMSFVRRRLRFDLLRTTLIALRGFRGKIRTSRPEKITRLDLDLQRKPDMVEM
jgi:hypothetical protein